MANVSSNSDVLVVDMVGGLLTGAVAERLGGAVTKMEGMFDLIDEVLKEIRHWRRELKELRLEIPIFEEREVVGWMIMIDTYFDAGEEDQIPKVFPPVKTVRSSISDLLLPKESPQRNLVCLLHKMQPLATCMHNLQLEKRAIGLQITEPWLREYQNSPSYENECIWRLHSEWDKDMQQLILSGTHLFCSAKG
ncbi:unnamed protein product [Vicia faba]|uniref:tRNA (adenine(58)-N(1))-methyltransferase non-catalytic subunit TRM6 n=1 Tax=Vicia faba TaxID=3906 RepID=A0AAV1AE15_VICFA|nr:unnamed protein product [Vicia faba]